MNRIGRVVALMILAIAILAVPAQASKPQAQAIEMVGQLTGPDTEVGTWTAAGFVNDAGTYTDTFRFAGESVHAEKVLVGSKGTIILRADAVVVWLDACIATFKAGSWKIIDGTGAYERLKGGGSPATTSNSFGDICTGEVQIAHAGQAHDD
jgi:hypothetical protein